ncbi:MAG: hypothetical protein IT365_10610 [Candidatus Hydrogenedentes bacterium]|nr:hypothetical protein [Candidatus Hydrogenedentota bacterium]
MKQEMKPKRVSPIAVSLPVALGCALIIIVPFSYALDPTRIEPAEAMDGKTFELEQSVQFQNFDEKTTESETSLEYEFNKRSALKLTLPVEWEEDNDTEVEVGLRYKFVFNPDAERAPIVAASIEALAPVDGGGGVDGELGLYLSKGIAGDGKHQLHLNLMGYYDNDAESDERDLRYSVLAGYSCQVTPKTSLMAGVEREQLEDSDENSNIVELGMKHECNETVAVALGVGAGIGEESPDFTVRAGISFRFGPGH